MSRPRLTPKQREASLLKRKAYQKAYKKAYQKAYYLNVTKKKRASAKRI